MCLFDIDIWIMEKEYNYQSQIAVLQNMQKDNIRSNSINSSPQIGPRRLRELKHRLSIQIKKILDQDKMEAQENQNQTMKKSKVYTDLKEVQRMKDAKSHNGFQHEYILGKKLGQGCHSSVYKCLCKKENKTYAVKILKQKDTELLESARESYRILKKLQHQNIIQAKNLFINQKCMTCHLVLDYCDWNDLGVHIKNRQKINKQEIAQILTELLKTVAFIHSNGVCHRDLKPDNILYNEKKKKIKIIDFEIARIRKYSNEKLQLMTKTGILSYRAPEIFKSIYDQKVDIWAIGIIAYQLLTGRLPFVAEYEQELIQKILYQEPSYENMSVWEQQLLQRLLCKDPQKRPTATQALSSPFLFMYSKVSQSPPVPKSNGILKSPSLGKEDFEQSLAKQKNFTNKFYDDDVTSLFLGGNQGDIGVIRYDGNGNISDEEN